MKDDLTSNRQLAETHRVVTGQLHGAAGLACARTGAQLQARHHGHAA
ncbi:hypothetical protein [Pseudoxanthomonas sp.]|nr:hypothetical protein [Pseudoxanthomonas sp.]WDS37946.1 MAG: hypothetical protein O8I58_08825 [Pseudoxanthomonas sp.]